MPRQITRSLIALLAVGFISVPLIAQNGPGGGGGNERPGGGFRGPRGDFEGGGRGGRGNFEGGPDNRRGGPAMQQYEMLRSYIEVVDRFSKLAQDPQAAGVAAVVSASDLLRQRGPDKAIGYFNKVLPEVSDPAVRRAIRIQLADLYKQTGETEKALEQLDMLMKSKGDQLSPTSAPSRD
jgi:hypothetical protein